MPHIQAPRDEEALYGLGWVTAEDRLLQVTLSALNFEGRAVEVYGASSVAVDRRKCIFGTRRQAQAATEALDPQSRTLLEADCQGFNDRMASGLQASDVAPEVQDAIAACAASLGLVIDGDEERSSQPSSYGREWPGRRVEKDRLVSAAIGVWR